MKAKENGKIKLIVTDIELPVGGNITDMSLYPGEGSYFVNDGVGYWFVTISNMAVQFTNVHPNTIRETFSSK